MQLALPNWLLTWREWFNPVQFATIGLVAVTAWFMIFGDQGLLMLRQLQVTRSDLLNAERSGLHRLHSLTEEAERLEDVQYLEGIIRRDLGYVRAGEVIYQFPQEASQ